MHITVLQFMQDEISPHSPKLKKWRTTLHIVAVAKHWEGFWRKLAFSTQRLIKVRKFLLERDDLQCTQSKFLLDIRKHLTTKKTMEYLDETWENQNYTVSKFWVNKYAGQSMRVWVPIGKEGRLIILHTGYKNVCVYRTALDTQTNKCQRLP